MPCTIGSVPMQHKWKPVKEDIYALTGFKRRTSELGRQLNQTKRPIILTVNSWPTLNI